MASMCSSSQEPGRPNPEGALVVALSKSNISPTNSGVHSELHNPQSFSLVNNTDLDFPSHSDTLPC